MRRSFHETAMQRDPKPEIIKQQSRANTGKQPKKESC